MRRVELVSLHLRNFKGLRDLSITFDGQDTRIYGANAAGKTSAFDGFTWLLFDKDSTGAKDFDIKTIDSLGRALSGLEHEVEGVLLVDDEPLKLRKAYHEVWTRKRGQAESEMTGHTTEHFIDDVPVQRGEYVKRIAEVCDEETWRLLSDPAAFQALHWQQRRRVLLEVCGDVDDAEVIASDPDLEELPEILGKHTIDQHRKIVHATRQEINEELKVLPARIDEVERGAAELPQVDANAKQIESVLASTREQRSAVSEQIAAAKSGGSDAAAERKRLREVEDELSAMEREALKAADDAALVKRRELLQAQQAVVEVEADLKRATADLEETRKWLTRAEEDAKRLRGEWSDVNARSFQAAHSEDTCTACGQSLPADRVEAAHEKARGEFNTARSRDLERIVEAGKRAAENVRDHTADIAKTEARITDLEKKLEKAKAHTEKVQAAPAKKPADVTATKPYVKLAAERDALTHKIAKLTTGDESAVEGLNEEAERLDALIAGFQADQATLRQVEQAKARVTELKAREKELGGEFERLERELYLCDQFTRAKVRLLEDRVAAKFEMARFKLFDLQVNGGLTEVCEVTYKGVPYDSLNGAARINIGLDVLNTLAKHHGLAAPVWVDQAESVTDIIPTEGQQIALVVSPADASLRVETTQLEAVA